MGWKDKKDELEKLINVEQKTYTEIGKIYGCSGSNIKKVALRLGIELKPKRKVNPCETFGKGTHKTKYPILKCINCGEDFINYPESNGKFCSFKCQHEHQYKEYIEKWKNGEINGVVSEYSVSIDKRILVGISLNLSSIYILDICSSTHEASDMSNCHSLTDNFGSRNKKCTKGRTEYFKKK